MNESRDEEELARQRFLILNLVRFAALALVLAGILLANRQPDNWLVGLALAIGGVIAFFYWPRYIARGWKSDGQ